MVSWIIAKVVFLNSQSNMCYYVGGSVGISYNQGYATESV